MADRAPCTTCGHPYAAHTATRFGGAGQCQARRLALDDETEPTKLMSCACRNYTTAAPTQTVVVYPPAKPYGLTDRQVTLLKIGLQQLLQSRGALLLDGDLVADPIREIGEAATAISRPLSVAADAAK